MAFGLDYSMGMPAIADMKAAGVEFVCRYVGYTSPELPQTKILTRAEASSITRAGMALVSNWEWTADRALQGYDIGRWDAQEADKRHRACGGPADRPIYFSVDDGVNGALTADYFRGIASVIGLARTAAYGDDQVLAYLFDNKLITWGWQTYAWSGGAWEPRAHIQQYANGMSMSGLQVDWNRSMKTDFGQWGAHMSIDLANPTVASYFTQGPGNSWKCKQTGFVIRDGDLDFYRSYGNSALCGLTYLGLPTSNEIALDAAGNTIQHYERGDLRYDPQHKYDNPPGSGPIYLAHIDKQPPPPPPHINTSEILAAARLIAETGQHIIDTVNHPLP